MELIYKENGIRASVAKGNISLSISSSENFVSFRVFRWQMDFYRFKTDALGVSDDFVPMLK